MKTILILILVGCLVLPLAAQDKKTNNMDLFVYFAGGVSGVTTDDAGEPFKAMDFSFNPGFSLRINDALGSGSFLRIDFGYREIHWVTEVIAAPYLTWWARSYLNLNAVIGARLGNAWIAGGAYFGIGIEGWWISEIAGPVGTPGHEDLGLLLEAGFDIGERLFLGTQFRYGFLSQRDSINVTSYAIYGTIGFKLASF